MSDLTFTFAINPELNHGADEAFNQCGESWWWCSKDGGMLGVGDVDLTGAKFVSIHSGSTVILSSKEPKA